MSLPKSIVVVFIRARDSVVGGIGSK